jgi:hypothetical protein
VDWYYMDPNEVVSDTRSLLALSDTEVVSRNTALAEVCSQWQ